MKTIKLFSVLVILIFTFESAQSLNSVSIRLSSTTGQDCNLASYIADTPLPNYPDIVAAAWTYNGEFNLWRPLFRFNLTEVPSGSQILSARLSLFANPAPVSAPHSGENKSYIRKVTTPWDQNTVTWITQPDFSTVNQAALPESTSPNQDYLDLDVTEMVRSMIEDQSTNFGFVIMNRIEYKYRSINFASSECADISKRPLLVITYDDPLPVELSSFTSSVNQRNVTLNWMTSSEKNNSGFEIYQSSKSDPDNWKRIGFVNGAGNSSSSNSYTFEDKNLSTGKYSYRLKQVDFNGDFKYYNLSDEIEIGIPMKYSLYQNYPNPFNPSTVIDYDIPEDANVTLKIFDMTGRELLTLVNEFKSAGYYTQVFNPFGNGMSISSGAYFYRIESDPASGNGNGFVSAKKMVLLK